MSSKRQRQNQPTEYDVHIHFGPDVVDEAVAQESCRIDAPADLAFFSRNPTAMRRERPASFHDLKAMGMLPGVSAVIYRGPGGSQIRMFSRRCQP